MIRTTQICVCLLLGTLSLNLQAQTLQEERLKAGYLVNFLEFVEWDQPKDKGHRIGVLNSWGLATKIDAIGLARKYNDSDNPLTVVNFDQAKDICEVDLLFVPRGRKIDWIQLVQLSENQQFILIGEEAGFLETGGVIQFVTTNNRLRFKINSKQAEKIGTRMSSKLLNLAVEVKR